MIRKIKAEDKEIYIKMAHDFYRMPAVDHPVPDSYLEKTFEECLKSDTYAELFILEWEGKIAGYGLIAKTFRRKQAGWCTGWKNSISWKNTAPRGWEANFSHTWKHTEMKVTHATAWK